MLDSEHTSLAEVLTFHNFGVEPLELPISMTFRSEFEDVFEIRGLLPEQTGRCHSPRWQDGALSFIYEGSDGLFRCLAIQFSTPPTATDGATAHFRFSLEPQQAWQLAVSLDIRESQTHRDAQPPAHEPPDLAQVKTVLETSTEEWLGEHTQVHSDSLVLNQIMNRSLRDLRALRSRLDNQEYSAGVPWFVTLFGRDSLLTALQTLAYEPGIAAQTLRLLASAPGPEGR